MEKIKTKDFFNNGKTGNNGLFKLYFSEGEERGKTLDDFTKKFLPLVGGEFEVLSARLRYREEKDTAHYLITRMYGGNKIIKSPQQIVREMHAIMTKPDNRGGKRFRDGSPNSWYYRIGKCIYVVSCIYIEHRKTWFFGNSIDAMGGERKKIRVFSNCHLY